MAVGIRKTMRASWHVIFFLVVLMVSLMAVAAYTPVLPLVIIFWIVVPVVIVKLWRCIKGV